MTLHGEYRSTVGRIAEFTYNEGTTIWEMVEERRIPINELPTICLVNGEPTLRKDWDQIIEHGETVMFISCPRGDSFRDIIQLVASIALAVFAPYAAGIIGPLFGFAAGSFGQSLIAAGIVIAGSFLLQALFPPIKPQEQGDAASPTYSLSAQGNTARLLQPMPKLYGTHVIYPDFAAQPYSSYESNQQFLYQLFSIGLGKYDKLKVRIEDTELWDKITGYSDNFTGLTIEFYDPGEEITLFPSQVITSVEVSGLALILWGTITEVDIDADGTINGEDGAFNLANIGDKITISDSANTGTYTIDSIATDTSWIKVTVPLTPEGSAERKIQVDMDEAWVGPFIVNDADTIVNKVQFDFFMPKGLYYANDEGGLSSASVDVEASLRLIDSAGLPVGPWVSQGIWHFEMATTTPQRVTKEALVDDGRYEGRVRRVTYESGDSRTGTTVEWGAVKGFIPFNNVYEDISTMAVKMMATGQLSQTASRRFNVIETAILPIYDSDSETWSEAPTRSIAWAAYDIATNTSYGGKYALSSIDLLKLADLDELWATREDYFDGVFDTQISVWDALSSCLRAGRASPVMIAGLLSFKRRGLDELPRCVFTPENIVRNSFETEHIMFTEESVDDVIIEFIDNRTWKRNEVLCALDDSTHIKSERQSMFGITGREQAWREGIFIAAYNQFNRITASFTTELVGRILTRGDYVIAGHDLFSWGLAGTVDYYTPASRTINLNRDVALTGDQYIMLRKRDGSGYGPIKCAQGLFANEVILDAIDLTAIEGQQGPIANVWSLDDDQAATNFIIATASTTFKRFTVVSGVPNEDTVDLVCIVDSPLAHTAEDDNTIPSETYPYNPGGADSRPVIATFTAVKTGPSSPSAPVVDFNWSAAVPTATNGYILQISYDGSHWDTVYEGAGLSYSQMVFPGNLWARVAGIATFVGVWKNFFGNIGTATLTPLPTSDIEIIGSLSSGVLQINWEPAVRASSYRVETWVETTVDSTVFDLQVFTDTQVPTSIFYTSLEVSNAGGPWKNLEVRVYSINSAGTSTPATEQLLDTELDLVDNLELVEPYVGTEVHFAWDPVISATSYRVRIEVAGTSVRTVDIVGTSYLLTNASIVALGGPWPVLTVGVRPISGALIGVETTLVVNEVDVVSWGSGALMYWGSGSQTGW